MPILTIEIVARSGEKPQPELASKLADAAADAMRSPGHTWVKLTHLPQGSYAEDSGSPQGDFYPVFVSVIVAEVPDSASLPAEVSRLTEAIAEVCERPAENVHVLYEASASGRQAFGGEIVGGSK